MQTSTRFTEALYPTGPKLLLSDAQEKCRKHTKRVEKMVHFLCKLNRNDVASGILRGCRWLIFFALGPCEWQSPKCRRPWPKCWLHHALTLLVVDGSFLLNYCLLKVVYYCLSLHIVAHPGSEIVFWKLVVGLGWHARLSEWFQWPKANGNLSQRQRQNMPWNDGGMEAVIFPNFPAMPRCHGEFHGFSKKSS